MSIEIDRDFVIDELERVCSETKMGRYDIAIVCPFHNDSNPSCNVHIGHKKPIGTYHCWSCGAKGRWEYLAEKLGLSSGQFYHPDNPFRAKANAMRMRKKEEQEIRRNMFSGHMPEGCSPWEYGNFRELPEQYLISVGAKRFYDDNSSCYRIVFPVKNRIGSAIGSVARRLDNSSKIPWLNSPGQWALKALYPIQSLPINPKGVVVVEGPYDALRLNYHGIPALSILGVQNWAPLKMSIIDALGIKNIILCMDGDQAGRIAEIKILESTKNRFKRKRFRLPIEDPKVDPGNMSEERLEALREVYNSLP